MPPCTICKEETDKKTYYLHKRKKIELCEACTKELDRTLAKFGVKFRR